MGGGVAEARPPEDALRGLPEVELQRFWHLLEDAPSIFLGRWQIPSTMSRMYCWMMSLASLTSATMASSLRRMAGAAPGCLSGCRMSIALRYLMLTSCIRSRQEQKGV